MDIDPQVDDQVEQTDDNNTDDVEALKAQLKKEQEEKQRALEAADQLSNFVIEQWGTELKTVKSGGDPAAVKADHTPAKEPDRDEDPDAWMQHQIQKGIKEALDREVGPLKKQYDADRNIVLSTAEITAQRVVAERVGERQFKELKPEVERVLSQFGKEVRGNPQAWEEAYYRVRGQKAVEQDKQAALRRSAADPGVGRPSTGPRGAPASAPELSDVSRRMAAVARMDDSEWDELSDPSLSAQDYLRLKKERAEKASKKKGR